MKSKKKQTANCTLLCALLLCAVTGAFIGYMAYNLGYAGGYRRAVTDFTHALLEMVKQ